MAFETMQEKLGMTTRASDVDRRLDEAVEDSFPASDPVQLAQPHDPVELGVRRAPWSMTSWMLVGGGLLALLAVIAMRR